MTLLGGNHPGTSDARGRFAKEFRGFIALSPKARRELLETFIATPALHSIVSTYWQGLPPPPYRIVPRADVIPGYAFRGSMADAQRFIVEVDGQRIDVVAPHVIPLSFEHVFTDPEDATLRSPSLETLAYAIASLPREVRALVQQVNLNPNVDKGLFGDRRSVGGTYEWGQSGRYINIFPTANWSFGAVKAALIHEAGHAWTHQQGWLNFFSSTQSEWEKALAADAVAASQYARENVYEDAAETFALYFATRGTPAHATYRRLMPNRFAILDAAFP